VQHTSESDTNSVAEIPEDNVQQDEEVASDRAETKATVQHTEQQDDVLTMTDKGKQEDDESQLSPNQEGIHDEVQEIDMSTKGISEKTEGIADNENSKETETGEKVELTDKVDKVEKEAEAFGMKTETEQHASDWQGEAKENKVIDGEDRAESQDNTATHLPEQEEVPTEAKPDVQDTSSGQGNEVAQEDETVVDTSPEHETHFGDAKESSATVVVSEMEMSHMKNLEDNQPGVDQVQEATTDFNSSTVMVAEPPTDERQEETAEQVSGSQTEFSQVAKSGLQVHPTHAKRLVKSESDLQRVKLNLKPDLVRSNTIEEIPVSESRTESADTEAVQMQIPKPEKPPFTRPPLNVMMSAKMLLQESPSGMSLRLSDDETTEQQHEDIILSESDTDELLDSLIPALSPGSDSKATSPVPDQLGHGPAELSGAEISGLRKEEPVGEPVGHSPITSRTTLTQPIAPILEGKTAADFSNVALSDEQVRSILGFVLLFVLLHEYFHIQCVQFTP
jgi:hypothetical protein